MFPLEFIVLATVLGVIVVALVFSPKGHFGHWKQLADSYQTDRSPKTFSYPNLHLYVGNLSKLRLFWFPWQRRYWQMDEGEYAHFDVECDKEGLWLRYKGKDRSKCADMMLIPWGYMQVRTEQADEVVLKVATDYFIDIRMPRAVGDVCIAHMTNFA